MQLDALTAEVRPRNPWEAIDLGMSLVRQHFMLVYRAWLSVTLPLFISLHLLLWEHWQWIPWIMWWLKPLLDRAPLYLLSRLLFGETPTLGSLMRVLPGLLFRQSLSALTWRRLDLARSFVLPISQLEGLNGAARRQRLRDLGQPGRGPAVWLTVVCANVELAMDFAFIMLVWMLLPDFVEIEFFDLLNDDHALHQLWLNLVFFFGLSLVEPFYVASGFTLYLNRRICLEAWDLQLGLQRLAARLQRTSSALSTSLAFSLMLILSSSMLAERSFAEQRLKPLEPCQAHQQTLQMLEYADSSNKQALAELLKQPDWQVCVYENRWEWRESAEKPQTTSAPKTAERSRRFADLFAMLVKAALLLGLAVSLIVGGRWFWKQRQQYRAPEQSATTARASATPQYGSAHPLTMPAADLAIQAWELWNNQQAREALCLLYRGSLDGLSVHYGVALRASATEEECLRLAIAQLNNPPLIAFLSELIRAWQTTAYGRQPPDSAVAQRLCREWSEHFVTARGTAQVLA